MSIGSILYTLFIRPPRLFLESVFAYINALLNQPGLSILALSLVTSLLLWLFFRRSESALRKEHKAWEELGNEVCAFFKTASGERKALLHSCLSRRSQWNLRLRSGLRAALELLLFVASYDLLSNLMLLMGVAFGPIGNLLAPDGMLVLSGLQLNLLPIILTVFNCASAVFFTKGYAWSVKVARYAMALLFLLLLYNAPSGLVLFWTVNSLLSLVRKVIAKNQKPQTRKTPAANGKLFLYEALFLSLLAGLWIPSSVLNASPLEFLNSQSFYNPLWYLVSSMALALGVFLVWGGALYRLTTRKGRKWFERILLILCGIAVVDYIFFGRDLGVLSSALKFENGLSFGTAEILVNAVVALAVGALLCWVSVRWRDIARSVMLVCVLALVTMSAVNVVSVNGSVREFLQTTQLRDEGDDLEISLSRTGQNVIVLMLDRAAAHLTPYIFQERPELAEQFSGFTFYDNTISYGISTNIASPALYGGYEYTPVELNRRADETLVSKQNEALKVMPVMFWEEGYDVTVYDPTYAGYQLIPDLSIYDDYPGIKTGITIGSFNGAYATMADTEQVTQNRNFFCYAVMKMAPVCLQNALYDKGNYLHVKARSEVANAMDPSFASYPITSSQVEDSLYTAHGVYSTFLDSYMVLKHLPDMTQVTDDAKGHFLMMSNDTTHEQTLLQEPDYVPAYMVDNTAFAEENDDRFTLDGVSLDMSDVVSMEHYHINMAALLQLGNWFDYLRELGVYDNTRIILVADHNRRGVANMDEFHLTFEQGVSEDVTCFYPLLMVKDFNASGALKTDSTFMTNADVPTLATADVIKEPKNPFSGNPISSDAKQTEKVYISGSPEYDVTINNGNVLLPDDWYSVHDDIWNKDNWSYEGYGTLPEGVEP